jgi:hypothetical protein
MAAFLLPPTRATLMSPHDADAFGAMLVARLAEMQILRSIDGSDDSF